jgi:hypothetical protein
MLRTAAVSWRYSISVDPKAALVRGNQSEKSAAIRMRKHRWVCDAGRA